MYKKILVPLDGSRLAEQALPLARRLASAFGAAVELLRASDPSARPPLWPELPADGYLESVREKYLPPTCRVTATEAEGEPAQTIIDRAHGNPDCVIAMATHGVSGARRWLLGSVAAKVAQRAMNPLVLIRPADGDPAASAEFDTVFVPLDGSALAEKILTHVIALAGAMKLEVHLLRVYTLPLNTYMVGDVVVAEDPAAIRQSLKDEASAYLDGKVDELRAAGVERVIATALEGEPANEIIEIARQTPKNLIAMSTHGRSGVGRWLLGSVAEKVVHHANDPVLLVRAG